MTEPELAPGDLFGGYRIERLLGRGGMGAVYAAEQVDDGRVVAVKVLTSGLTSATDRERFLREGQTAASINHPNTVYVYRTEEVDDTPTIVMELVAGGTLEEKVAKGGPLSVNDAITDILQIVDGLEAAHRVGILHRDVKPANCFVDLSGVVKVGDFGLSRPIDRADQVRLTQTGLFLGTPVFSSPEQLMGDELDVRADIYAVGATLYYLLTGRLPFEADSSARLIALVINGTPASVLLHRPDVPPALAAVVMRCLARQREDRFPDYGSLRDALAAVLPTTPEAVPLGQRFSAGVLDQVGVMVLMLLSEVVMTSWAGGWLSQLHKAEDARSLLLVTILNLPLYLLWFGWPEARYGWSPGKWLAGARVERVGGGLPGLTRGLVRAFVIWLPWFAAEVPGLLIEPENPNHGMSSLAWLVGMALLFVRARPSNGFAAEQDRYTDTRVVLCTNVADRPRATASPSVSSYRTPDDVSRIGPYEIIGRLASCDDILVGFDPQLKRTSWIVRKPVGTPPLPLAERDATRVGRARWIAGRRSATESWDAYAAVAGAPLRERLAQPADWEDVQKWLHTLVVEMAAQGIPTAQSGALTVNHVWISEDGQAIVLPFALGAPDSVLREFVRLVQTADQRVFRRDSWPLRARSIMSQIRSRPTDLAELERMLADARRHMRRMSARRRVQLWLFSVVPTLVVMLSLALAASVWDMDDADQVRMSPLLEFIDDTPRGDTVKIAQQRMTAEYFAAHFRDRVSRPRQGEKGGLLTRAEWRRADSIVAAHPSVSADRLRAAERLVDSTWHGVPPGELKPRHARLMLGAFSVLMCTGLLSLVTALTARRGMPSRMLALDYVTSRGTLAGRGRLLWRQALIWIPLYSFAIAAMIAVTRQWWNLLLGLAAAAILFVIASYLPMVRDPGAALPERLSGTRVVPE